MASINLKATVAEIIIMLKYRGIESATVEELYNQIALSYPEIVHGIAVKKSTTKSMYPETGIPMVHPHPQQQQFDQQQQHGYFQLPITHQQQQQLFLQSQQSQQATQHVQVPLIGQMQSMQSQISSSAHASTTTTTQHLQASTMTQLGNQQQQQNALPDGGNAFTKLCADMNKCAIQQSSPSTNTINSQQKQVEAPATGLLTLALPVAAADTMVTMAVPATATVSLPTTSAAPTPANETTNNKDKKEPKEAKDQKVPNLNNNNTNLVKNVQPGRPLDSSVSFAAAASNRNISKSATATTTTTITSSSNNTATTSTGLTAKNKNKITNQSVLFIRAPAPPHDNTDLKGYISSKLDSKDAIKRVANDITSITKSRRMPDAHIVICKPQMAKDILKACPEIASYYKTDSYENIGAYLKLGKKINIGTCKFADVAYLHSVESYMMDRIKKVLQRFVDAEMIPSAYNVSCHVNFKTVGNYQKPQKYFILEFEPQIHPNVFSMLCKVLCQMGWWDDTDTAFGKLYENDDSTENKHKREKMLVELQNDQFGYIHAEPWKT